MGDPRERERERQSPLERETGEPDVHPEEQGRSKPDTSGGPPTKTTDAREETEEGSD
ncbi:hypothetical protein ACFW08_01000 [Streptomyces sp. NPDC058960]|uniref:hypothetical protein n=1 Tax=Streptomyces sp. NPDC058960 TaxID=3346679 RepID=UPI00369214CD